VEDQALVETGQAFEGSLTHQVYLELCASQNHTPVQAKPQNAAEARKPAPNPILDNLTVGEFRKIVQGKG
jgi:hypothetical protein